MRGGMRVVQKVFGISSSFMDVDICTCTNSSGTYI